MTDAMRHRRIIIIAAGIGLLACLVSLVLHAMVGVSDLVIPHCAARAVLAGGDPYACPRPHDLPSNPFTTVLIVLPLAPLPLAWAGAVLMGLSSGLLAFGILRSGQPWRLLAFASLPYAVALFYVQWSILLLAIAFVPALYPLLLAKPHVGIAVGLLRCTPRRALGALALGLGSLLLLPAWPWRWLAQTGTYDGSIPILLPGMLILALALPLWRSEGARWLLVLALTPQRAFYDQLLLVLVPQTPRGLLALIGASWLLLALPDIRLLYLAALAVVLVEQRQAVRAWVWRWAGPR